MSMSVPDLEARLAALRPPPPREGLREHVLVAVRAELGDVPRPSFLDRLLARRATWAAAAAVLVALVTANLLANDARERRLAALGLRPGHETPVPREAETWRIAWRNREAQLAQLLGEGRHDG